MEPGPVTSASIEGGCACGAVRYAASAPPTSSMICHCRSCRRSASAPAVPWVTFPRASFAITQGEPRTHKSSLAVTRAFCGVCGSPLTYVHEDRSDEIDVTTCSLDAPEAFPPEYHAWLADDLPWVRFDDGRTAYREWRTEG